jgi:sortase (surface protein transpeptidase)
VIGRLNIDLPLVWGDIGRDVPRQGFAGETPERVALVFPGSALPGSGGNTYIYSHARTGMFLALWSIRREDVVILRWPDGEMRYVVERVEPRVDPSDVSWLDPAGPERLTLQTSTGPSPSDPRFIAVAHREPET